MKNKINTVFNYLKDNILVALLISILITIIAPFILTRKLNFIDFTNTGQIGDTIGGITAPFINIINAILIYIAFTEQLKANNLLKDQLDADKSKEKERLSDIKKLILFDLERNILPSLNQIKDEIPIFLNKKDGEILTFSDHIEFNDNIYKNVAHPDLLKIFGDDFKLVTQIYSMVGYIKKITALNISFKYPTERASMQLITLNNEQYQRIRDRNKEKIRIELQNLRDNPIEICKAKIYHILRVDDPLF
ncbi:hypothetical protein [Chryseobacterium kwangjuense]|uniref:Uncharacterized protein n=1 Tax=Chryseobacterium kwangjuense TaxID=267125 RepID=A0A135W8L8_9FLAO|nr:hypothetical protein [Chryseobacterium kwangjuense]KXH81207.1 hypothetical protein AU378_15955 [Chryseobacterium kwangjuense]